VETPWKSLCGVEWGAFSDWAAENGRERAGEFAGRVSRALLKLAENGTDPRMHLAVPLRHRQTGEQVLSVAAWKVYRTWIPPIRAFQVVPGELIRGERRSWSGAWQESSYWWPLWSPYWHRAFWLTRRQFHKRFRHPDFSPLPALFSPADTAQWWISEEPLTRKFFRMVLVRAGIGGTGRRKGRW
jgi:hypothetical protein